MKERKDKKGGAAPFQGRPTAHKGEEGTTELPHLEGKRSNPPNTASSRAPPLLREQGEGRGGRGGTPHPLQKMKEEK